jgi:DnaJ family protein C protein 8
MKEAEVSMKKRKAEEDARWEGLQFLHIRSFNGLKCVPETREARVGSWRSFAGKPKKKKKAEGLLG